MRLLISHQAYLTRPIARIRPLRQLGTSSASNVRRHRGFAAAIAFVGVSVTAFSIYQSYSQNHLHNFPEPVAKPLRRALYYSSDSGGKEYGKSLLLYRDAIEQSKQFGMDPSSDEVTGLKIQMAGLLELLERKSAAATVYTNVLSVLNNAVAETDSDKSVLRKRAIGVAVKLGRLQEELGLLSSAHNTLERATTSLLEETRKRGQSIGESNHWLSNEETGGVFEAFADVLQAQGKVDYAVPLYLQCLPLCRAPHCHSVILMNNIAAALAMRNPADALQWAHKSLEVSELPENTKDEECQSGRLVSLFNLGMITERQGNLQKAKDYYMRAGHLAKELNDHTGASKVDKALERLKSL